MDENLKFRIHGILEPGDEDSRYFDPFIMGLIVLNVLAVVLETVDWIYLRYSTIFDAFELFSVSVFSVEYILRIWSCTIERRFRDPIRGRLRFMITPLSLIDLLAILPFYLPLILPELRFLRAVRLFRLFRMLKLSRYSESLQTFGEVLRLKREELSLMLFTIAILLVVSSSLMYQLEHDAQPEAFSSIPAAMWWGVVTLATVGYGDMFPVTPAGKLIGSVVVILGIGLFALPTGIIAAGFSEIVQMRRRREAVTCPHCGMRVDLTEVGKDEGL